MRAEYAKLINIDSPGPDVTVPVTLFVGLDIQFFREKREVHVSQKTYIRKLREKYKNKVTMNDMPTPTTKAKREAFDKMEKGTEETSVDPAQYLEGLGQVGWVTVISFPELAFTHSTLGTHTHYPTREAHAARRGLSDRKLSGGARDRHRMLWPIASVIAIVAALRILFEDDFIEALARSRVADARLCALRARPIGL